MRPIEFYLDRVRAFPGRPVVVWGLSETDDFSSVWELYVVFEELEGAAPWSRHGFQYEDPVTGRHPISVAEVQGRRFAELLMALPPGDVFDGDGSYLIEDPPGYERDFDGSDRVALEDLGKRLADALGIPFALEPVKGPFRPWHELPEGRALFS